MTNFPDHKTCNKCGKDKELHLFAVDKRDHKC